MKKTPEQLAEEYATPRFETYDETKGYQKAQRNAFLAGFKAGEESTLDTVSRMDSAIDRMFQRARAERPIDPITEKGMQELARESPFARFWKKADD